MTVFTCEDTFEAMMTCVYDVWASRLGHDNLRLQLEPVWQQGLFCDYVHVDADFSKAAKVVRAIQRKIVPRGHVVRAGPSGRHLPLPCARLC